MSKVRTISDTHGKIELNNQIPYVVGKPYKIKDILNNLEWFWDYRKLCRLPFYSTCLQFFQDIHDGVTFETDDDLKAHPYFQYHLIGWNNPQQPKLIERSLFHMREGIGLYHKIKKDGMISPIEAWRDEKRNKINIHRGLRRIAIQHALGKKIIPIRLFKNRTALEKIECEKPQGTPDNSIHGLAVKQFAKEGHRGTDKYWIHNYTPAYNFHLSSKRAIYKKILEIGVSHGGSLLLWHDVFPKAQIYGVDKDISRARLVEHLKRVTLLQGRQGDDEFFRNEVVTKGKYDLIVDDCTHKSIDQKETLELLWGSVKGGGFYVIEDLYWRSTTDSTAMDKLKLMIDDMNNTLDIASIHFYYNIVFVRKA